MMVAYKFAVRLNGSFVPGLKPVWMTFRRFGDGVKITGPPINELGDGYYGWAWDAKVGRDVFGTIDAGPTITNATERFIEVEATRETGTILSFPSSSIDWDTRPSRRGLIAGILARLMSA